MLHRFCNLFGSGDDPFLAKPFLGYLLGYPWEFAFQVVIYEFCLSSLSMELSSAFFDTKPNLAIRVVTRLTRKITFQAFDATLTH